MIDLFKKTMYEVFSKAKELKKCHWFNYDSPTHFKCPKCGHNWDSSEYFSESIDYPINLICDCGHKFSAKVKITKFDWELT